MALFFDHVCFPHLDPAVDDLEFDVDGGVGFVSVLVVPQYRGDGSHQGFGQFEGPTDLEMDQLRLQTFDVLDIRFSHLKLGSLAENPLLRHEILA